MSLLREIQDAAVSSEVDVTSLLRKCKILAARLGNDEFKEWVENELNGYRDGGSLPVYRVLTVQSLGDFSGAFGSGLKNAPIPSMSIEERFRELTTHSYLTQPISFYQSLLKDRTSSNFRENWPANLVAYVARDIYQNMACMSAWKVIPANSIAALLDTIKTRILSFCLEIESFDPQAGEAPLNSPTLPQERVTQVFNTYISGDVQNVATGSTHVQQTAITNSGASDQLFIELIDALRNSEAQASVKDPMIAAVEEMRDVAGSPSFADRYRSFMGMLADHIQVLGPVCAPYLQGLSRMLGQ